MINLPRKKREKREPRKRDIPSANHYKSKNNHSFYAFTLYVFTYFLLCTILCKKALLASLPSDLLSFVDRNYKQRRVYMRELFEAVD